jgi:quercetin dioxygenase-like cupin family protein
MVDGDNFDEATLKTARDFPNGFVKLSAMRIRTLIILVVTVVLSFGFRLQPAYAQDPAVVNSKTIRVRFENDRVRVLEAILPPGVKEQVHSHPAYVIYVLEGGRYRNYAADGKITEGELKTGDVIYRDPLTHAAENIGDKPLDMILVELKSDSGADKSSHP